MSTANSDYQELHIALKCFFTVEEQMYLIPLLLTWSGNADKAMFWFNHQRIPALGGQTAKFICENGNQMLFIEYIHSVEFGGYA
ncbi:hypothetical protein H5202_15080 [Shewanella sp. SG41-4]|uniref:hypothetical protein n=1 Tax=Shewanella sp. SG41-4 TaxID=2760976 RepID=UPI0015FF9C5B|nr:hypothetical protein [Shewanella sp. SG41-4]MBB1439970.1 hypothetical protein [Shewanella sp. SG41-4]